MIVTKMKYKQLSHHELEEKVEKLPPSARIIYDYISRMQLAKPKDLIENIDIPARTIRHALKRLVDDGLVLKIPDFNDLRSSYYKINDRD